MNKREVDTEKQECNRKTATQECDEEKVIQLFQEFGLQDTIMSLSDGNDDEVENKVQQCLTIFKDPSGSDGSRMGDRSQAERNGD